jgi:hypothetical protein
MEANSIYPQWRERFGSYHLHTSDTEYTESIFRALTEKGRSWVVGEKSEGTWRIFESLDEAKDYGMWLHYVRGGYRFLHAAKLGRPLGPQLIKKQRELATH